MISKSLLRAAALSLIACLLADPATACAYHGGFVCANAQATAVTSKLNLILFQEEAVVQPLLEHTTPIVGEAVPAKAWAARALSADRSLGVVRDRNPQVPIKQISTTNLGPKEELTLLRTLLARLRKERKNPGSAIVPVVAVISDQHGTIDKFDALVLDAIRSVVPGKIPEGVRLAEDESLQEQLAFYGVEIKDLQGRLYFHNLGDFMDRGRYGIKIFRRSSELVEMGLSDFVIGNHDFWEFMNLQAFHLPWYDGYNFYGYSDDDDPSRGNVEELVRRHRQSDPDVRTASWWAGRLAKFTALHEENQKTHWNALDDIVNGKVIDAHAEIRGTGLFAKVSPALQAGSNDQKLWDKFRGWYSDGDAYVFTGVRAVGSVSIKWWQDLLRDFETAYAALEQKKGFAANLSAAQAWREAIQLMREKIIPPLRRELEVHLWAGEWWWRVFEAINYQNYSSPEWWAKDWVFHEGWGTSVFNEVNEYLSENQRITRGRYLNNPTLNRVAHFFREHFTLYIRDLYQNTYMHAFLPVDRDTGEFYFTYKNQEYRGKGSAHHPSMWAGLDRITQDVRNPQNSMKDLYEALFLVNSWYADNTTQAKVPQVAAAINKFSPERLAEVNGFNRLFTGHLPFYEFSKLRDESKLGIIDGFQIHQRVVFTDHGMGTKFGSRGAWVYVGPKGLYLRGFEHENANGVVENPRTVKTVPGVNGESVEMVLFQNRGLSRDEFLLAVIKDIEERIRFLEKALAGTQTPQRSPATDQLGLGPKSLGAVVLAAAVMGAASRGDSASVIMNSISILPVLFLVLVVDNPVQRFLMAGAQKIRLLLRSLHHVASPTEPAAFRDTSA